jgi:capsular exopolysaccharide synthesis family protein
MSSSLVPSRSSSAPVPDNAASTPAGMESFAPQPQDEVGAGHALSRALAALRRFRWLIIGFALAGIGGGIVATRFIKPDYEVAATIWIETPSKGKSGTPIQGEELLDAKAWVELLTTFKVLDPVVQERRLFIDGAQGPDSSVFRDFGLADRFVPGEFELSFDAAAKTYTLRQQRGLYTETGVLGDSIGRKLGWRWAPHFSAVYLGRKHQFEVVTPREASEELTKRLTSVLREDNFLILHMRDKSGVEGAATMNALLQRFVDEAAAQKRKKLTLLSQVLDTQVDAQAERLRLAEEALERYRVNIVTLPREELQAAPGIGFMQPTVYQNYFAQRNSLDSLRRDRMDIEAVLSRNQGGEVAVDAFNTINAVRQAPDLERVLGELSTAESDLRALREKYTDDYRPVKDLKDRIQRIRTQTIPLYAQALVRQLKNREAELDSRIKIASQELESIPVRSQTEARLRREVEQAEELYKTLESNRQEARLAEASAIPDVRILDSAVAPTHPSRNSAPSIILLGLLAGLILGGGLVLLVDQFDHRFRYPDQVSAGLGLPILGTIPVIPRGEGRRASSEDAAQVVEAFRTIRLSLAHCFDPAGPILLTVSSPAPGDGKSLIASNLALSFAEAGYKTVLVDGDIRRGQLHHSFGTERRPGLVDHLAGEATLHHILRPTTHAKLTLIPSGSRRQQGPELLGTARMQDLIASLRDAYQVIIFDSPPLGAGIDPFVLSTLTGHLAVVLRAGETDRQLAEAKLRILDRLPVRLLGAILNDVRISENAYKYYRYSYGYAANEEEEAPVSLRAGPKGSSADVTAGS